MDEAFEQIAALEVPSTVILSGAGNIAARTRPATGTVATGRPYIVAISNLYDHKRVDLIIDAYATEPTLRATHDLVIGGKEMVPGTIAILRKQARELGLADSQVRFPGFVSGSTLAALYQSASLYVSASEHEAFPLTPAEALISGLPVVLTDIPPFREIYGDWATFVPVGQVVGLRRAMVAALDNGARDDHGAAVSQRFSWNRNAQELAAVLLRVASGPRPTWRESFDRVQWSGIPRFARAVFGSAAPHGKRS
jgi:alpha-1,3-rhamnosyl/mannosyltransferase